MIITLGLFVDPANEGLPSMFSLVLGFSWTGIKDDPFWPFLPLAFAARGFFSIDFSSRFCLARRAFRFSIENSTIGLWSFLKTCGIHGTGGCKCVRPTDHTKYGWMYHLRVVVEFPEGIQCWLVLGERDKGIAFTRSFIATFATRAAFCQVAHDLAFCKRTTIFG